MSTEAIQADWRALRDRLDAAAEAMKNSQAASVELSLRYGLLEPDARPAVDELLREWVLSDDEKLQFDALSVIRTNSVTAALPELRELLVRERDSQAPGADFKREKLRGIIDGLETVGAQGPSAGA